MQNRSPPAKVKSHRSLALYPKHQIIEYTETRSCLSSFYLVIAPNGPARPPLFHLTPASAGDSEAAVLSIAVYDVPNVHLLGADPAHDFLASHLHLHPQFQSTAHGDSDPAAAPRQDLHHLAENYSSAASHHRLSPYQEDNADSTSPAHWDWAVAHAESSEA